MVRLANVTGRIGGVTPAEIEAMVAELVGRPWPSVVRFDLKERLSGRVALLPSAFNPPTYAHLALLDVGARYGAPAALLSTRNVDKGLHGATLEQRIEMLLASSLRTGNAVLATNEARFVDQARAVRRAYPGVQADFVVGYDTLVRLFDPRYYEDMPADLEELFGGHRVIATNRGEASRAEVERFLDGPVVEPFRDRIMVEELDGEHAVLSSSAARAEIERRGLSDVVPPHVARYIREHGLYR